MEEKAANAPAETKPCKVCAEPINKLARKCIHCDSYQDWRANLTFSSTVLSLLVALTAVAGGTVPAIVKALTPENSDLRFSFQAAGRNDLTILATNTGIRPGSLRAGSALQIRDKTNPFAPIWGYLLGVDGGDRSIIFEPQKSQLLSLSYLFRNGDRSPPLDASKDLEHMECIPIINSTDFKGKNSDWGINARCASLRQFLSAVQENIAGREKK